MSEHAALVDLSPREREVVTLLAAEVPYKEVARRLGISIDTVGVHAHRAAVKLGLPRRWRRVLDVKKPQHRQTLAEQLLLVAA